MRLVCSARIHSGIATVLQRFTIRLVVIDHCFCNAMAKPFRCSIGGYRALLDNGAARFLAGVVLREPLRKSRPSLWHESVAPLCLAVVTCRLVLGIDCAQDPKRAKRVLDSHLKRAH